MGSEPTGVDATIFAFVVGMLCPQFETPIRTAAERHDNLRRYVGRMTARYYPDLKEIGGCKAAAWCAARGTARAEHRSFGKSNTPGHGRGLRE